MSGMRGWIDFGRSCANFPRKFLKKKIQKITVKLSKNTKKKLDTCRTQKFFNYSHPVYFLSRFEHYQKSYTVLKQHDHCLVWLFITPERQMGSDRLCESTPPWNTTVVHPQAFDHFVDVGSHQHFKCKEHFTSRDCLI